MVFKNRKYWFTLTIIIVILGYFFKNKSVHEKEYPTVSIIKPTFQKIPLVLDIPTTLIADEVALKARTKGELIEIHPKESDIVKENQLLFKIDSAQLQTQKNQQIASLNKSKAQLTLSEKQLCRSSNLLKKGIHTQEQWDTYKANTDSLKADVDLYQAKIDELDINIKNSEIKAPFLGRIGFISIQKGDYLNDNAPTTLTIIQKICTLEGFISIPEKYVSRILSIPTDQFKIKFFDINDVYLCDASNQVILDQKVNESTGTFSIKFFVDNNDLKLKAGMSLRAKIELGFFESTCILPSKAIFQTEKGNSIYTFNEQDQTVHLQSIDLESILGDKALIKTPLQENECIVTEGQIHIHDGSKVVIQK